MARRVPERRRLADAPEVGYPLPPAAAAKTCLMLVRRGGPVVWLVLKPMPKIWVSRSTDEVLAWTATGAVAARAGIAGVFRQG